MVTEGGANCSIMDHGVDASTPRPVLASQVYCESENWRRRQSFPRSDLVSPSDPALSIFLAGFYGPVERRILMSFS
jgi:hypothetical protein